MVSALKVGGKRLYELARAGEEIEREARPVRIDELVVEDFEPGPYPQATIRVACSSGTYIRTLAADLGAALGGCAHMSSLRRLRVGGFVLDDARTIEEIEADPDAAVLPPTDAVRDLERVTVDAERARAVAHGATFAAARAHRRSRRRGTVRGRRRTGRVARDLRAPRRGSEAVGRARHGGDPPVRIYRDPTEIADVAENLPKNPHAGSARRRARSRSARSTACTSGIRPCCDSCASSPGAAGSPRRSSRSTAIRRRSCGPVPRRSC